MVGIINMGIYLETVIFSDNHYQLGLTGINLNWIKRRD